MTSASESRIPLSQERRRQLKRLKRGGEPYDTLLAKMIQQFDPNEVDTADAPELK